MIMQNYETGKWGETIASEYLTKNGYSVLKARFRGIGGEIDLIAREGETLVFIEVKARRSDSICSAIETIRLSQRKGLIAAAEEYLFVMNLNDVACRFDCIGIDYEEDGTYILDHRKDAFWKNF